MYNTNQSLLATVHEGEEVDALYRDLETGELFAVELKVEPAETWGDFTIRCAVIAREDFETPRLVGFYNPAEIERMGIDVY